MWECRKGVLESGRVLRRFWSVGRVLREFWSVGRC